MRKVLSNRIETPGLTKEQFGTIWKYAAESFVGINRIAKESAYEFLLDSIFKVKGKLEPELEQARYYYLTLICINSRNEKVLMNIIDLCKEAIKALYKVEKEKQVPNVTRFTVTTIKLVKDCFEKQETSRVLKAKEESLKAEIQEHLQVTKEIDIEEALQKIQLEIDQEFKVAQSAKEARLDAKKRDSEGDDW